MTERAARRYVAILREADIPVESTRGPYGGYTLGRGLRLPPLVFSATEALGLVMAALDSQHAVADADDPVGSALGKILRVLPTNVARQAVTVRETARTVPERFSAKPDPAVASELVAAVAAQRQVRVGYRTAAGNARTFEVDPWSVVVRYGRWYLLCHSHHADALRTFRIDRITGVEAARGDLQRAGRPRPGGRARGQPRHGLGARDPRRLRRPAGRGTALDPADARQAARRCPTAAASWWAARATRRRTPVSGWPACPSPSRWSAAGAARGGGRGGGAAGALAHLATATSLPRFQPSEMGR